MVNPMEMKMSSGDFNDVVDATAQMLAGRFYDRTAPRNASRDEFIRAQWPRYRGKALDLLAMKAALMEAEANASK